MGTIVEHYARCSYCNKEMRPGTGCKYTHILSKEGKIYERDTTNITGEPVCHDCNAPKGQPHHAGCDNERCPVCHRQFISCDCKGLDQLFYYPRGAK